MIKLLTRTVAVASVLLQLTAPLALHAQQQSQRYVDGIVAVVNEEVITISTVLRQTAPREQALAQQLSAEKFEEAVNDLREKALDSIIEKELMYAEFKSKGYTIPNDFLSERLSQVVASEAGGDWELFRSQLADQNMTLDDFRERLHKQLAVEVLYEEEVRKKVSVTEDDIQNYYYDNKEQFTRPEKVKLQLIFLNRENRTQDQLVHAVEMVMKQLDNGVLFGTVAKRYSDHPSAEEEGVLGWMPIASLNPRLQPVAINLEIGTISMPVGTAEGVYFLKVHERTDEQLQPLSAVRKEISNLLEQKKQRERYEKYTTMLERKFYVKKFL